MEDMSAADVDPHAPLRIVLLANTLPPRDVSGVGEQVLQLAAGLRARGHRVEVIGRRETGLGASKLLFPLTAVPALARAVRRVRPHVVQVHESDGALAALWLAVTRKLLGRRWRSRSIPRPRLLALLQVSYVEERRAVRPLVAPDGRVLGWPGAVERRFRRFKAPLQIVLGRLTARLADRVLCPSAATAAEVARDYGVSEIGVLPNVTGAVVPRAAEEDTEDEGEEALTLPEGPSQPLLFVGRLRLRKGVEVLLEALREVSEELPDPPPVWIAGDGEHRATLEARVRELGLDDRVRFLGRRTPGQVRALLPRARALVVSSIYEGMPLVVLEAMEAGLPVVASAVSGIPEVVVDGETGWLVPAEDPVALATALGEVLDDPAEAHRRGAAGRRRLDERYRPEHAAARWEEAVGYSRP
jgi:glycosyltransferase involved in cell wall biosynthesis